MKKTMAVVLSGMMAASVVAGCSSSSSEKGPEKLTIAARGGTHVTAMESVKAAFEKEHHVTIEILGLESADLKQKVTLDAKNKKGAYDLIMADDPWMPEFSEAKIFAKLSGLGVKEDADFEPSSLALGKHPYKTGDLYALPFAGNVQLFFYNKKLLDSKGLRAPESWDEVLDAAGKIKASGGTGYVIRGQQGNPIVSDFLPVFWAYGGQVFDSDWKAQVHSDAGKKALNTYIKLLASGANYEQTDIVSSVSEGRAAMALGWPSWFIKDGVASADYAPIPSKATVGGTSVPTGMIGNWMMGVAANSANKDLAAQFLTFITSSESQKIMAAHGGVPTRKSVYLDSALNAKFKHFPIMLSALQNSVARPRTPKWSRVEEALGAELSAAVAGTKSVDDALASAKKAIDQIMQ